MMNAYRLSTATARLWLPNTFPTKRKPGLLKNWLISGVEQKIYKIRMEHHLMTESKEAKPSKELGSQLKEVFSHWSRMGQYEHQLGQ